MDTGNLGPLQEQLVLLSTEPALQLPPEGFESSDFLVEWGSLVQARLLALWAPTGEAELGKGTVLGLRFSGAWRRLKICHPLETGVWEDVVQSWSCEHTGVFKAVGVGDITIGKHFPSQTRAL